MAGEEAEEEKRRKSEDEEVETEVEVAAGRRRSLVDSHLRCSSPPSLSRLLLLRSRPRRCRSPPGRAGRKLQDIVREEKGKKG